jgi:hypothetical protein
LEEDVEDVEQPEDLSEVQNRQQEEEDGVGGIGASNSPVPVQNFIVKNARTRFKALKNKNDHNKLLAAIIRLKSLQ